MTALKPGDYVVATKYADGDPGDAFCVGFYSSTWSEGRHLVIDVDGKMFRASGFRRVARVSTERGRWMVEHLALIEKLKDRFSVWHWYRAPWWELRLWHRRTRRKVVQLDLFSETETEAL